MASGLGMKDLWNTKLDANDSTAQEELGILRYEIDSSVGLKAYRYVQAKAAAIAAGEALSYSDLYKRTATNDISTADINQPAGVGQTAITVDYYGWIQVYGYYATIDTDTGDDIADGDWLILHASTDGVVDRTASGVAAVSKPIGVAVAADVDADDTVAGFIDCL